MPRSLYALPDRSSTSSPATASSAKPKMAIDQRLRTRPLTMKIAALIAYKKAKFGISVCLAFR